MSISWAQDAMGSELERRKRRARGEPTFRLVRYTDDFVVVLAGLKQAANAVVVETAAALAPLGLTLSEEKTRITHTDDGIEFLGWRICRRSTLLVQRVVVRTYRRRHRLAGPSSITVPQGWGGVVELDQRLGGGLLPVDSSRDRLHS
jgi:Reverse transcriptase (RNA-dependent DNA polymerase)